ncbi:MAG: sodium transporter, partial [Cytophagales bacterium]|nr:sodium transporter [Cytophagales bacterium]
ESFASLWEYLQVVLGYISPPIVGAFLVGLFYRRANANGAFYSFLVGYGLVIIFVYFKYIMDPAPEWTNIHFLLQVPILMVICVLTNLLISNLTSAPPAEKIKGLIWTKSIYVAETKELQGLPWYKNYRVLSILLLVLTALIVGWYW